ncbi:MAG TPA: hypothetical protein VK961_06840 [Chthoniobacter sp.]|nr:hypothetical protein [Chthoniobacter sp.]
MMPALHTTDRRVLSFDEPATARAGVGLPPMTIATHTPAPSPLAKASDKERDRANEKHWIFTSITAEIARTGNKRIVMDLCKLHAAELQGRRGFSAPRLYNDFYKWQRGGSRVTALLPARYIEDRGMPAEAMAHIHGWMQRNQRSSKQGWRDFLEAWQAGEEIVPGYGTWRDWFMTRWPDRPLPRICPPDLPTGWGYENLIDKLDAASTKAARLGIAAALAELPSIPGTRAGMRPLEWITFDDVKLDFRVHVDSVGRPVDVVCLVAMDIATGAVLGFGVRPVLLREDGTGEKLKARDVKALIVQILQAWGWPAYGMHIIQENGTAYADPAFQAAVSEATGGLVRFHDASMISGTAWAGGFADRAVGNSRAKSWMESLFNPMHNRLASIEGQTGRRYDVAPQDDHGRRQELKALVKAGETLAPELRAQLRMSYRNVAEVRPLLAQAIRGLNDRHDHALKDFEEILVWRFREGDQWMEEAEMLDFTPAQLEHILTDLVLESPAQRYERLLSIERAASVQFFTLHPDSVPRLLEDQKKITKEAHEVFFQMGKKDCLYSIYTPANEATLAAMEAGREYLAYFDASSGRIPPERLYVTTGDGRWIGTLDLTKGISRTPADAERAKAAIAKKRSLLRQAIDTANSNSPQVAEANEAREAHNIEILQRARAMTVVTPCPDNSCPQTAPEAHSHATAEASEDTRIRTKARQIDPSSFARQDTARAKKKLSAQAKSPTADDDGGWA